MSSAHQIILAGGISDFDVGSLIMAFGIGRQAIRLELRDPSGEYDGQIVMQADWVVSAVAGELTGVEAMQRLLAATHAVRFKVFRESREVVVPQVGLGRVAEFTRPTSQRSRSAVWRERIPVLEGSFADFNIRDVMRSVAMARQYSIIEVLDDDGANAGTIHLKAGQIVSAKAGSQVDWRALRQLLVAPTTFRFAVFREFRAVTGLRSLGWVAEALRQAPTLPVDAANGNAGAAHDRPSSPRSQLTDSRVRILEGSLSEFDIATLLQAVSAGRQFVEVQIFDRGNSRGTIELKAGVLVGARMGMLQGFDAARCLLQSPAHCEFVVSRVTGVPKAMTALSTVTDLLRTDTEALSSGIVDDASSDDEPRENADQDEDTVVTTHLPVVERQHRTPSQTALAPVAVMDGNLAEFDIPSVLQVVGTSRQRTSVRVFDDQRRLAGEVHLKGGHVLTAEAAEVSGVAAVRRLLHSPRDFTFVVVRHQNADDDLASIGAISDVLGDAIVVPARPAPIEGSGVRYESPPAEATPAVVESRGRRPYVAWLGGASVGAAFMLLSAVATMLLVRREPIAPMGSGHIARGVPIELESRISAATDMPPVPAAATPAAAAPAPMEGRSVGSVFGQADPSELALGRPAIASMQAGLKLLGYDPGGIDGIFGPHTSAAIKAFQHAEHLSVDGTFSALTRSRLAARVGGL